MGYVVRPKPTAAMLETPPVGYRSGISPLSPLAVSQKKRNVRSWRSLTTTTGSSSCASPSTGKDSIITAIVVISATHWIKCRRDIVTCQWRVETPAKRGKTPGIGIHGPRTKGNACAHYTITVSAEGHGRFSFYNQDKRGQTPGEISPPGRNYPAVAIGRGSRGRSSASAS